MKKTAAAPERTDGWLILRQKFFFLLAKVGKGRRDKMNGKREKIVFKIRSLKELNIREGRKLEKKVNVRVVKEEKYESVGRKIERGRMNATIFEKKIFERTNDGGGEFERLKC